MTELSLYEQVSNLSTVKKQWFFDLFQGDALDTDRWQTRDIAGTGTFSMSDTINGGFTITTSSTTSDRSQIDFNDKRQFSNSASVIIGDAKCDESTNRAFELGLTNTTSSGSDFINIRNDTLETFYNISTKDATTESNSDATVSIDESWHRHNATRTGSSVEYSIDGVLEVTHSTNMPTAKLQPLFRATTRTTAPKTSRIRYMECYNV